MPVNPIGASGGASALYAFYQSRLDQNRRQINQSVNAAAVRSAARNPSQPNTPVQPVSPVTPVTPDESVRMPAAVRELPSEQELNNAQENLVRMQVRYPEGQEPVREPLRAEETEEEERTRQVQREQETEEPEREPEEEEEEPTDSRIRMQQGARAVLRGMEQMRNGSAVYTPAGVA